MKAYHLHIKLNEDERDVAELLRQNLGCRTRSEVFRRALALLNRVLTFAEDPENAVVLRSRTSEKVLDLV